MRFLTVRELRAKLGDVWKTLADEHEIVLTNNGRPVAILTDVAENSLEDSLAAIRRARATVALVKLQTDSASRGLDALSDADIAEEISSARKKRHR
jgi:prevent-host-death family protein